MENKQISEAVFYILLSLVPGPRHGYAILKDVQEMSDGRIQLSTGTLYGALKRLLEQEWVTRVEETNPDESGRERKFYALSHHGQAALDVETNRLQSMVSVARTRFPRKGLA